MRRMHELTIATRESRLALWQAEHVRDILQAQIGAKVSLLGMTTRGDQILDRSLSKVGGKGLFVKELETALEERRADLAVHSLKDVPMDLPKGFTLAAILEREDPRDAFVSSRHASFDKLPHGACVGTSSLRRLTQLKSLRPDLRIEPLRGNLDTRLRKLDEGQYDAIVLAAAGLRRLGLASRIASLFEATQMLPAAGQGALGIEVRSDDDALRASLATLIHTPTWLATHAERAVSRSLGGSCSMPLAAHARWDARTLHLEAALGHAQDASKPLLRVSVQASLDPGRAAIGAAGQVQLERAEALGQEAARGLLAQPGARAYLDMPAPDASASDAPNR